MYQTGADNKVEKTCLILVVILLLMAFLCFDNSKLMGGDYSSINIEEQKIKGKEITKHSTSLVQASLP